MPGRAITPEELLGQLNDVEQKYAPDKLYVAGRVEIMRRHPRISIVGTRNPSPAGLKNADHLARTIANHGGVVVSGLAKGIDAAAHKGAITAGGDTAAVLGTPLDRFYPKENEALQRLMMQEQLVVSQFAPGEGVGPKGFIMRNRTMALLSDATVIIEAGEKSGTRHQGWEVIRLGRTLYLPQNLIEKPFDWPRKMLEYGAIPYADLADLEAHLEWDFAFTPHLQEELGAALF